MKYRSFYIQLAVLIIFNIILFNFPLTNILGYEFSVLNSILITFLSGLFCIRLLKEYTVRKDVQLYYPFRKFLSEGNILFLSIPLLMGTAASLFIKNCSLTSGFAYYSVLTLPAVITGTSLGLFAYFISERVPRIIFIIIYLIILSLPLYELYFNPQIYFYNPILGYLPGTIYDEAVKIDARLILYRLLNILFFSASAVYMIRYLFGLTSGPVRKSLFLLTALVTTFLFFILSRYFGFATTHGRMRSELNNHVTTKHFEIFFDESIDKKTVKLITLHHEFYFTEVSDYLKVNPSGKITSYIFRDSAQKKKLLGTANADMAKPWMNTIFVNYQNFEETLKHEIVHSLSAEFGATIFKIGGYLNPSLTEGIASAVDDEYDENSIHFMSALASRNGYKTNIPELFSGLSFFGEVSGLSYITAGSFCRFLIDTYGVNKFKKVYSGEDFDKVYNKHISELSEEYYKFIDSYPVFTPKAMADYYYGRLTIFRKPCARYLAEQLSEAWKKFDQGKTEESRIMFSKLFSQTDSYPAFSGYVNSLIETNNDKTAFDLILQNLHKYINTAYYFNTCIILADVAVKLNHFAFADSIYGSIIKQKPSEALVYLCLLRMDLLKDTASAKKYISGDNYEKYRILTKMNSDGIDYASIPVLITLSEQIKEKADTLNYLINYINVKDSVSSFAAYKLAEFQLRKNNYAAAKILADKALLYPGSYMRKQQIESDLKKINWLLGNSEL